MARSRTVYRCRECGHDPGKWLGRCPACDAWGTLTEVEVAPVDPAAVTLGDLEELAGTVRDTPIPLAEVDTGDVAHRSTGLDEVDRVLGGGLVPGAAVLLGGEPGIGKSTLVLQVLHSVAAAGRGPALLVTAEESKEQVRLRASRLGALHPACFVVGEESAPAIGTHMETLRPSVVAVDSIQTVRDPRLSSGPGSVAQVRESASCLLESARRCGATVVLVGHVTKDGALAGPRVLEHVVDVVLSFEGDRHHSMRVLRGVKNRFGPAGELGIFDMRERGLVEMADASAVFLGDRRRDVSGSAVVPAVEGRRPLMVEVQALVVPNRGGPPRRTVTGLDANRVTVLCGVLDKRAGVNLAGSDVFVCVAGGVRVRDPASDLAMCLAMISSADDVPLPPETAFLGEVGLGGEVRAVPHLERRVREAVRFGFTSLVVPATAEADAREAAGGGADVLGVADVCEAARVVARR